MDVNLKNGSTMYMSVSLLKEELEHKGSYYFSKSTLRFFGERLSDMYILKNTQIKKSSSGDIHECFVLSKLSKSWDGVKFRNYDYFDINTLKRVQ